MDEPDAPAEAKPPRTRRVYAWRNPNTVASAPVLPHIPVDPKRCKLVLDTLLREYNHQHMTKCKEVSYATREDRRKFLRACFAELKAMGYKLDPRSLKERHVKDLVQRWMARGLSAGTIQDYLSFLRALSHWIAKPGLVRRAEYYAEDSARVRRSGVALEDKSWAGRSVDVWQIIAELKRYSEHAAVHVLLMYVFGLRIKEVARLQPHVDVVPASATGLRRPTADCYLRVARGSKTGRPRDVPIDAPEKWQAIERARRLVADANGHLGYPGLSLKDTLQKMHDVLKRFGITEKDLGVTAHGLRHEYGHRVYRAASGVEPPVRGGPPIDPLLDTAARLKVAAELGHARKQISSAYLGGIARSQPVPSAEAEDDGQLNPVSRPTEKEDL